MGRMNKNHKIMSTHNFVVFVHSFNLTSKNGLFVKQWSSEAEGKHLERHRVPDNKSDLNCVRKIVIHWL